MQITAVSRSIQPKHRPKFTSFSTSELCGTDEGSKSTSFRSKGRQPAGLVGSREFIQSIYCFSEAFMYSLRSGLSTFFGKNCEVCLNTKQYNKQEMKKVSAIARHEGRQSCAEKASAVSLPFNKTQNTL